MASQRGDSVAPYFRTQVHPSHLSERRRDPGLANQKVAVATLQMVQAIRSSVQTMELLVAASTVALRKVYSLEVRLAGNLRTLVGPRVEADRTMSFVVMRSRLYFAQRLMGFRPRVAVDQKQMVDWSRQNHLHFVRSLLLHQTNSAFKGCFDVSSRRKGQAPNWQLRRQESMGRRRIPGQSLQDSIEVAVRPCPHLLVRQRVDYFGIGNLKSHQPHPQMVSSVEPTVVAHL
jgi:hypothetical protein